MKTKAILLKAMQILIIWLILTSTVAMAKAAPVSIYADKEEVVECETVTLTVTGPINHTITIASYDQDNTIFPGGVTDNPASDTTGTFNDIITEEQTIKKYTVYFIEPGDHRIKLVDTMENSKDYVDIPVVEKQLITFDATPSSCAIGDLLLIVGTVNAGNTIDVAIDDEVVSQLNDIPIDTYYEFSVELDTSEIDFLKKYGTYRLKGYIDRELGEDKIGGDEAEDGSIGILMLYPSLEAEVSKGDIDRGGTFVISGKAPGSKEVDILIVSPTGSSGSAIESESTISGCPGINHYTLSVARQTDDTFSKTIHVDETAYGGNYAILVLSRGYDGVWGNQELNKLNIIDAISQYHIQGKTQEHFIEIFENVLYASGSDDLGVLSWLVVRGTEEKSSLPRNEVIIPPSSDKVALGDEYKLSGECYGSDFVNIVTISPKGGGGRGLTGKCGYDIYTLPVKHNTFEKVINVDEGACAGWYSISVLSPGANSIYAGLGTDDLKEGLKEYNLGLKTQGEFVSLLQHLTCNSPGSDDVLEELALRVERPYLRLDTITGAAIGDPLTITGTTNKGDGTIIVVALTAMLYEAPPVTTVVRDGKFSATMDTSDLLPGTYLIEADDGDGHVDENFVDIKEKTQTSELTPESTVKTTATPEPSAAAPETSPVATAVPATMEPTPEEPGFEAVVAITGLLAAVYLLKRKK
jgi:PGF-CTERM protein